MTLKIWPPMLEPVFLARFTKNGEMSDFEPYVIPILKERVIIVKCRKYVISESTGSLLVLLPFLVT